MQGFFVCLFVFILADPIDPQGIVNGDVIVRVLFDGLIDECVKDGDALNLLTYERWGRPQLANLWRYDTHFDLRFQPHA